MLLIDTAEHVESLLVKFFRIHDFPKRLLTTFLIMMKVIDLNLDCRVISGKQDVPDVILVAATFLVSKKINGLKHILFNPHVPKVFDGEIGIFHNIVKESYLLL